MKKFKFLFLLTLLFLGSCSSNDESEKNNPPSTAPVIESVELSNGQHAGNEIELKLGSSVTFTAKCSGSEVVRYEWDLDGKIVSTENHYLFTGQTISSSTIKITVYNKEEKSSVREFTISVTGSYKNGTFILLEGNMSNGNGTLCFIDDEGNYTEDIFGRANKTDNRTPALGNILQDLFIYKDNIYIICQNGKSKGEGARLIVADAQTLQLKQLVTGSIDNPDVWPQHIVVVNDDKAYIRWSQSGAEATSGIRIMNLKTMEWSSTDIEGTKGDFTIDGSSKMRMLILGDKVFAPCGRKLQVIDTKTDKVVKTIDFNGNKQIKGIVKGLDGNIWMAVSGTWEAGIYSPTITSKSSIVGIKSSDFSIISKIELPAGIDLPVATWTPNIGMCASFTEDALFFWCGDFFATKIYRHEYKTGETRLLVDISNSTGLSNTIYGVLGVDKQNVLYVGTTDYLKSAIGTFSAKDGTQLEKTYLINNGSPAGIDFTYRFSDSYTER